MNIKLTATWRAAIKRDGQIIVIGDFVSEIEAAKAYDKRAKELFGQYARLNLSGEETKTP